MFHRHGSDTSVDVVLIGAGIMSATLGVLIKTLQPDASITIIERLDRAAAESSDAWNNAGTGHSAFCELNYTPQRADGSVDISKAVAIAESFEISKQFWACLIERGTLQLPRSFINRIPHMSFVWGDDNVAFLRNRYTAMQQSALFEDMEYSEDHTQLTEWMPLIMAGRDTSKKVAATRMAIGTDVNFGALTQDMLAYLQAQPGVTVHFSHEVEDLHRDSEGNWQVHVEDRTSYDKQVIAGGFVFIGAGGGSLPLLMRSGIPESKGFGGFPVSGQWLVCNDPTVIAQHEAKVYGKAAVGSPPMSVPHLDTRVIDGEKALFFGPYAGFSTRFLKHGSLLDLPLSVRINNMIPMLAAGMDNLPLTRYLIEQVVQSPEDRLDVLRDYVPSAEQNDWELKIAGQRVQVIKKNEEHGGILEFGTEVVSAADGSIAALLGASPGASTAVTIMIDLLGRCFPEQMQSADWQAKLQDLIPSYGRSLSNDRALTKEIRAFSSTILEL